MTLKKWRVLCLKENFVHELLGGKPYSTIKMGMCHCVYSTKQEEWTLKSQMIKSGYLTGTPSK